jgi:hypothetical protein
MIGLMEQNAAAGYGYEAERKKARKAYLAQWAKDNPDKVKAKQARYNRTEKAKLRVKRYNTRHPEQVAKWRRNRKESGRASQDVRRYRQRHPERVRATKRRYAEQHPDRLRAQWSAQQKRRYATDPQFRMTKACRGRVQIAFKSQGARMTASTSKLVG